MTNACLDSVSANQTIQFIKRLPWPALIVAEDGIVIDLNDAMYIHADIDDPRGQSLQEAFPDFFSSMGRPSLWTRAREARAAREINGTTVHQRLVLQPLPGETMASLMAFDETRWHSLERELVQTQRLASLGFMAASICHEVGNPLTAIDSLVQLLRSEKGQSEEVRAQVLTTIDSNVSRLLSITRQLNEFSRVGTPDLNPIPIDHPAEMALALLRHEARASHQIKIDHNPRPDAIVRGSAEQLQQVFYNLFSNSVQAMEGSGILRITTLLPDADRAVVAISDTGPGIRPEHMDRLFDPFFTTRQEQKGSGLGLTISKEIIHEHGGSLRVESSLGSGTTFYIELPVCKDSPAP